MWLNRGKRERREEEGRKGGADTVITMPVYYPGLVRLYLLSR